eukprot:8351016-Pyramimonas_sp.AAC.1
MVGLGIQVYARSIQRTFGQRNAPDQRRRSRAPSRSRPGAPPPLRSSWRYIRWPARCPPSLSGGGSPGASHARLHGPHVVTGLQKTTLCARVRVVDTITFAFCL